MGWGEEVAGAGGRGEGAVLSAVDRLGARALAAGRYAGFLLAFVYLALKMLWVGRRQGMPEVVRQTLLQVYFTGVQGILPLSGLAVVTGVVAVAYGLGVVQPLAAGEGLGRLLVALVLFEVGPLLTAGVVIVRSVTAIAAELGVMRVQREIEALEVMGISPILHLVTPRLLGGLAALAGLNVVFAAVAVAAGVATAAWLGPVAPQAVRLAVLSALSPQQVGLLAAKVAIGGMAVLAMACYHGMEVEASPTEVPVAVSRAALRSLVLLVIWHASVSLGALVSGAVWLWGAR